MSRSVGSSKLARLDVKLALVFVVSQLGVWTGCNAILGNGYGAFDESTGGAGSEGGTEGDALGGGEGGAGGDGNVGDGSLGDGNVGDGSLGDSGSCRRGLCPTMLTAAPGAQRIALGTIAPLDYVYWVSATSVGRVGVDGKNATVPLVVPGGTIAPPLKRGIAVTGAGTPFVTVPTRGASKCASDLSSCAALGFIGTAGDSSSIAIDASYVYVGVYNNGAAGAIYRSRDLNATASDSWNDIDRVLDIQVVGANLFYRTSTTISQATPTTQSTIASPGSGLVGFSIDGTTLAMATTNNLITCTLSAAGTCVAAPSLANLTGGVISAVLVYGGTHVVWAEGGSGGSIHRCVLPMCPTTAEVLADNQASPVDLAVDSNFIYWANQGDSVGAGGAIMKLPK